MRISDWSSGVCSSDLLGRLYGLAHAVAVIRRPCSELAIASVIVTSTNWPISDASPSKFTMRLLDVRPRSEERRVGTECVSTCRSRWSRYHLKQNKNNHTNEVK